jgi:hypothetical protein
MYFQNFTLMHIKNIKHKSKSIFKLVIKLKSISKFCPLKFTLWLLSFKKTRIANWITLTCLHPHACEILFKKHMLNELCIIKYTKHWGNLFTCNMKPPHFLTWKLLEVQQIIEVVNHTFVDRPKGMPSTLNWNLSNINLLQWWNSYIRNIMPCVSLDTPMKSTT